jgi:restriction system protein
MQSFIGALRPGDNGMYVSTGGFSPDAMSHAINHHEPIATFNREEFIKLLVDHYDQLESDFKGYIPLTKVWIPIE